MVKLNMSTGKTSLQYFNPPNSTDFNLTVTGCDYVFCQLTKPQKIGIALIFAAPFLFSFFGNLMITTIILTNKTLRMSKTSISILNLAICDLLIAVFCMPVIVIDMYVVENWFLGDVLCKLVSYVQHVAVTASMLNLTLISAEKFLAVCYPLRYTVRKRHICLWISFVWVVSLVTSIYPLIYKKVILLGENPRCIYEWSSVENIKIYTMTHTSLTFFFPLTTMSILSFQTGRQIKQSCSNTDEQCRQSGRIATTRKYAVRLLKSVVLCSVLLWSPYHFLQLASVLVFTYMDLLVLNIMFLITMWLFFLGTACHPILYGFVGDRYRTALKDSWRKRKPFSFALKYISSRHDAEEN